VPESGSIPFPAFATVARPTGIVAPHPASGAAAERIGSLVGGRVAAARDAVELSAAARAAAGAPLSAYRTPAERVEAATGVARGRLVDRLA